MEPLITLSNSFPVCCAIRSTQVVPATALDQTKTSLSPCSPITFACTDNKWKYASSVAEGSKTPEGPAIDLTVVEALTAETNGLAATNDNPVVVSAKAGSRTTDKAFIYVAQTEASWTKDANLTPGNYKAEIKVTVAAN